MKRIAFWLMVLCLALPGQGAHAATVEEARALMDSIGQQALATISNAQASKPEKQAKLEALFKQNVDIPWVGRFVLGRYWRQADDAQRGHYLTEYEKFLTANYADRFADYNGGSYKITRAADEGEGQFSVTMLMVSQDNHQQVNVDYKLHMAKDGAIRIFDVVVEGVSLLTTQRSEFASVLQNHGLDYLIQQMASHAISTPLPTGKAS